MQSTQEHFYEGVVVDYREPLLYQKLKQSSIEIKKENLAVGDVVIKDLVIERKTRRDLESSIVDKRIFFQIKKMKENYKKALLIIEGTEPFERINRSALLAFFSSLVNEGFSVVFTRNLDETAEFIYWLYKKSIERGSPVSLAVKKPKEKEEVVVQILESLPGVGYKRTIEILKNFSSLKDFFSSSSEEIARLEGFGKKRASFLFSIFNFSFKEVLKKLDEITKRY